jgi:hypothetical protein
VWGANNKRVNFLCPGDLEFQGSQIVRFEKPTFFEVKQRKPRQVVTLFKRPFEIFAVAGALIPFVLITANEVLTYFNPNYIGSGQLQLFLWPSSFMLMALHGADFWSWSTLLIYSLSIAINFLLYAFVGSVVAAVWSSITKRPLPALRIILWSGVALAIGSVLTGVGRPIRYELPDGYKGWVVIEYYNSACPPLESKGIFHVVKVPSSGRVCMSGLLQDEDSWRLPLYEYVRSDGTRRRIPSFKDDAREVWAGNYVLFQTREEGNPQYGIFVGNMKEYENRTSMPYTSRKAK